MPRRKVTTTVYLTERQAVLLKQMSVRSGVPVAEYIRRAVDAYLDKAQEAGELDVVDNVVSIAPVGLRAQARETDALDQAVERALRRLIAEKAS